MNRVKKHYPKNTHVLHKRDYSLATSTQPCATDEWKEDVHLQCGRPFFQNQARCIHTHVSLGQLPLSILLPQVT
jgi:hypothetical protein